MRDSEVVLITGTRKDLLEHVSYHDALVASLVRCDQPEPFAHAELQVFSNEAIRTVLFVVAERVHLGLKGGVQDGKLPGVLDQHRPLAGIFT